MTLLSSPPRDGHYSFFAVLTLMIQISELLSKKLEHSRLSFPPLVYILSATKCEIKSLSSPSRSHGFMSTSLAAAQLNVALRSFVCHGWLVDLQLHNCDVLSWSNTEVKQRNKQRNKQTSQH